ncbi:MAG: GNAT family N-acetyltransferase [Candidatus Poribacteria bacterium]|nr:GNAT family N-acetyltransferase [Candidatus Poribacteria bacterium]
MLRHRLEADFNDISLTPSCNKRSFPKESVQLASQEGLAFFASHDCEELNSALTFALDTTARAWLMSRAEGLQALACWRPLPWDSQVLGCPSGSMGGLWAKRGYVEQCHRLETVLKACIADAQQHDVRFLSLRLPENALAPLHAAEAVGFRIIESFLTFRRKTTGEIPSDVESNVQRVPAFHVRLAHPDEVETVADLAFRTFQSFRLFIDPLIPEARARHSRREWVRNGFKGRAEAIYVAESENRLVGFVLLRSKTRIQAEKIGEIELIAVDPAFSGRGIGKALVATAIRHYQGRASEIEVGTQGNNLRAIGLYTRMGFSVVRSDFSLHRHLAPSHRSSMIESSNRLTGDRNRGNGEA